MSCHSPWLPSTIEHLHKPVAVTEHDVITKSSKGAPRLRPEATGGAHPSSTHGSVPSPIPARRRSCLQDPSSPSPWPNPDAPYGGHLLTCCLDIATLSDREIGYKSRDIHQSRLYDFLKSISPYLIGPLRLFATLIKTSDNMAPKNRIIIDTDPGKLRAFHYGP